MLGACASCTWPTGSAIAAARTPGCSGIVEALRGRARRVARRWARTTAPPSLPGAGAAGARRADRRALRARRSRRGRGRHPRPQRDEPGPARVGGGPPQRAADRAGSPAALPGAGQVDARGAGLPATADARAVRLVLRGRGLLRRDPRAHRAAAGRGAAAAADGAVPLHARGAGGGGRARRARARRAAVRAGPRPRGAALRPAVRAVRRAARRGEGRVGGGRGLAPLGARAAARARRHGAAARAAGGGWRGHERIEIAGWLDRRALSAVYARARALLLPSRWQEPFGIVGLEALAFGVPVAAWESGGVGEWHPGPGLAPLGRRPGSRACAARGGRPAPAAPPRFERDEAVGRLLALYGRLAAAAGRRWESAE